MPDYKVLVRNGKKLFNGRKIYHGNKQRGVREIKEKVEDMGIMIEELLEIYTDVFCDLRDDYLEKLEEIRKERGRIFSSIEG